MPEILEAVKQQQPSIEVKQIFTVEEIFETITSRLSKNLFGLERQEWISEKLDEINEYERSLLRDRLDSFLYNMVDKGASDIDIGGNGSKGQIWFRIFADKRPVPELGAYSTDQFNVLCLNILSPRQQQHLFKYRNLDFSHAVDYKKVNIRFRGDCYFDLDNLAINMRRINNNILSFKELKFQPNVARA